MMDFLLYDVKVAAALLVFYLFYRFLLKKETFHRFNRIVLVGTAVLSFLLPLCIITIRKPMEMATSATPATTPPAGALPELSPQEILPVADASAPWWPVVLTLLFWAGVAFVLSRVIISILSILRIIHNGERVREEDGCHIIVTDRDIDPFSWMRYIVLSRNDWEGDHAPILVHEKAHIGFGHSIEVLLVDILSAVQWFNPAIWMLRADLQELHEYEADDAVLRAGADLGVIFDTDCDRAAVVDADGKEINRNRLIALISAILLEQNPRQVIVTDSVTSSGLSLFIRRKGGEHYRFKRGYRNVIDEAIRLNREGSDCPLAIETSGHAALRENHFLDDGMYLVTVLIVTAMQMKQQGKNLGSLIADLKEPAESTEIRLNITDPDFRPRGQEAIQRILDHAEITDGWHIAPDNREGVRISFDLGGVPDSAWFLLRLSVHDPVLPLNAESDIPGGIKTMLAALAEVLDGTPGIDMTPLYAVIR